METNNNDYLSIEMLLKRKLKRLIDEKLPLPDILMIDGGIGQLNIAKKNEITNLFKFVMERLPKGKKLNNALKLNFGNLLSNINLTSQDVKILTSIIARLSDKNSKKL